MIDIERSDQRYTDIDDFKKYELTSCISFEMAMRNKHVKAGIIEILKLKNYSLAYKEKEIKHIEFKNSSVQSNIYSIFEIEEFEDYMLLLHTTYLSNKYYININNIFDILNTEDIDFFLKYYKFDNYVNFIDTAHMNKKIFKITSQSPIFLNSLLQYQYNYSVNELYWMQNFTEEPLSKPYTYRLKDYIDNPTEYRGTTFLTPNFSRPILEVPLDSSDTVNVLNINLNLPLNEIQEYIKSIYESFHENSSQWIGNPVSYFEACDTLDSSLSFGAFLLCQENNFYPTFKIPQINLEDLYEGFEYKSQELSNTKSPQTFTSIDWADCFYIYDFYQKSSFSQKETARIILENLNIHHGMKVDIHKQNLKKGKAKTTIRPYDYCQKNKEKFKQQDRKIYDYTSVSTIISQYKMMVELIENLNYKQFVRGYFKKRAPLKPEHIIH